MKHFKITQLTRVFFAGASIFAFAGIGSCSMSMRDFCAQKLPEMNERLALAASALDGSGAASRGIASGAMGSDGVSGSVGVSGDASPIGKASGEVEKEEERQQWMSWAEDRLSETQQYMDAIEGLPGHSHVRRELSDIATELVSFHGYTRQGKRERMVGSIVKVRVRLAKARELACATTEER